MVVRNSAFAVRFGGYGKHNSKLIPELREVIQRRLNGEADARMNALKDKAGVNSALGTGSVDGDRLSSEGVRTITGLVTRKGNQLFIPNGKGEPMRILVNSGTVLPRDANHVRERLATRWDSAFKGRAINEAVSPALTNILELLKTQKSVRAEVSGYTQFNPVAAQEFFASRIAIIK